MSSASSAAPACHSLEGFAFLAHGTKDGVDERLVVDVALEGVHVRAVADLFEREHGEGLLDEDANLLDAEEGDGDHDAGRDDFPSDVFVEREGEEGDVEHDVAGGVARVGERDGRLVDALAGAEVVVLLRDVGVHALEDHRVDARLFEERADGVQAVDRLVVRLHEELDLARRQDVGELYGEVLRGSQVAQERLREGGDVPRQLLGEHGVLDVGDHLAREVAAAVERGAPQSPRLRPPTVRRVRTEHEQERERAADDVERRTRDASLRQAERWSAIGVPQCRRQPDRRHQPDVVLQL
mmetsp:Transcript_11502/g.37822  ORF Transcript_11502/g.37822 Transcript_11502/m.37822 type:complete len:297 (+) Transcript_11502:679-1569(+)